MSLEKILEFFKNNTPVEIAIPASLQLIILSGMWNMPRLEVLLPPDLQKIYLKMSMATIVGTVSLLYLSILGSYIFLYLKYRTKLVKKIGILWDKDREAHCPSCKTLLSNYGVYTVSQNVTYCGFTCIKCDKPIYLTDRGLPVNLEEAKKLIWGDR